MNQTYKKSLHAETVQSVCVREKERECVCVLPIDEKGMERREEWREEGDSERVEVRVF